MARTKSSARIIVPTAADAHFWASIMAARAGIVPPSTPPAGAQVIDLTGDDVVREVIDLTADDITREVIDLTAGDTPLIQPPSVAATNDVAEWNEFCDTLEDLPPIPPSGPCIDMADFEFATRAIAFPLTSAAAAPAIAREDLPDIDMDAGPADGTPVPVDDESDGLQQLFPLVMPRRVVRRLRFSPTPVMVQTDMLAEMVTAGNGKKFIFVE